MSNLIKNITEFALYLVQGYVSEGDVVVDATCGNGYDTLRLAQLSPAKLYAFDIQQEAVDATRKRLREAGFAEKLEDGTIEVICDSHEHLTDHVKT
ncbi:MAG: class I SAM-dependent methyltransferase, partial [Clostridia bacterium]